MDIAQTIATGLVIGSIYALASVGLVFVYKSSQVMNFSQGQFIAIGAMTAFALHSHLNLPIWLALFIALVVSFYMGIIMEKLFVHPFLGKPFFVLIVVTFAMSYVLEGLIYLSGFGFEAYFYQEVVSVEPVNLLGVSLSILQLVTVGVSLIVILSLAIYFHHSHLGIYIKAVSNDKIGAMTVGIDVAKVFRLTWGIAFSTACLAGFLLTLANGLSYSPLLALGFIVFPVLIIGGVDSLAGTVVAGFIVGVLEQLSIAFLSDFVPGQNVGSAVPFAVALVILFVWPTGIMGGEVVDRA